MWRNEIGMMEMLLSYISEFNTFDCWSSWRPILVDILSSHEEIRRQRITSIGTLVKEESSEIFTVSDGMNEDDGELSQFQETSKKNSLSELMNPQDRPNELNYDRDIEIQPVENEEMAMTDRSLSGDHHASQEDFSYSHGAGADRQSLAQAAADVYAQAIGIGMSSSVDLERLNPNQEISYIEDNQTSKVHCSSASRAMENYPKSVETHFDVMNNSTSCRKMYVGERPFTCSICGKSFRFSSNLNVHRRIHTGERPYFCKVCGKSFSRKDVLTIHLRTHNDERPYQCVICGKKFTQLSNMKSHMTIHSRESPSCPSCGKQFSKFEDLKLHMHTIHDVLFHDS